MIDNLILRLKELGLAMHFSEGKASYLAELSTLFIIFMFGIALYFLLTFIFNRSLGAIIKKSHARLSSSIIRNKVLKRFCMLIPFMMVFNLAPKAMPDYRESFRFFIGISIIAQVIIITAILISIANTLYDMYNRNEMSKKTPLKGLLQVVKIVLVLICVLMIVAFLMHKRVSSIVIGLGTMSAVMMLIFQNPILGFVGGIQLAMNDMLRIGDWIVMGNADGEVIDISLTTVKVQNWDKTITTIPMSSMISNQFTNWRGMEESGVRRIMRSINIDMETVRFCTPEMIEKYRKYDLVADYIEKHTKDIVQQDEAHDVSPLSGNRLTNLGVFRAYLQAYIQALPYSKKDFTMFVRQLDPKEFGIPLQVYFFSSIQEWTKYEDIQSDLFDHIIASIPLFDLRIYQRSSGHESAQEGSISAVKKA